MEWTVEDYKRRDASIVSYLKFMIAKHRDFEEKYPLSDNQAKRKAYQDCLFKINKGNLDK